MVILNILAFLILLAAGATFFVEYKIIEDLPETNSFKKWWRRHVIGTGLED